MANKLKNLIRKILFTILDYPLPPPSGKEKEYANELRNAFMDLNYIETDQATLSEREWSKNAKRLRELVLNNDPRKFLRWDVILNTMFIGYGKHIGVELNYLKNHFEWEDRWRYAIRESSIGRPLRYPLYWRSSANLIQHAYHIAKFEDKTGTRVDEMDYILEFGGGYGSMCRAIYNLGFTGRYIIYDLPYFSSLQKYYLKSLGFQIHSPETFDITKNGIFCVSNLGAIQFVLKGNAGIDKSLFIATWSISEAPISIRESFGPLLSRFENFLITYQDKFGEVDNIEYFRNWVNSKRDTEWHSSKIVHSPQNYYLIGERKIHGVEPRTISV